MKYNLVRNGDDANVTAFINGEMYTANNEHPSWDKIVAGLNANDESVAELFNVEKSIMTRFERISERVTVRQGNVYFDGEAVNNTLTSAILRFMDEGADFKPLVNFFEKAATNPNEHSREQLYRWLDTHDFSLTPAGDIVGYKGVAFDEEHGYKSQNSGEATVNGEVKTGQIPNPLGAVVEMPRGSVQHDPSRGCHTGLHVGTWDYARNFSRDAVLEVHVNPRDVVSVPTDCSDAKMRVCRYVVVKPITSAYDTALVPDQTYSDNEDDDENDECDIYCDDETCDC